MKRWEDDVKRIAGPDWIRKARDRETWKSFEEPSSKDKLFQLVYRTSIFEQ